MKIRMQTHSPLSNLRFIPLPEYEYEKFHDPYEIEDYEEWYEEQEGMLEKDVMSFMPRDELARRHYPINLKNEYPELALERAKYLSKELPSKVTDKFPEQIANALQKLIAIKTIASTIPMENSRDMIAFEQIDNITIKADMHSMAVWADSDAHNEVAPIDPIWIFNLEYMPLKEMAELAKTLMDKLLLKDKVKEKPNISTSWTEHERRCNEVKLDPYKTSTEELEEREKMREELIQTTKDNIAKRMKEFGDD